MEGKLGKRNDKHRKKKENYEDPQKLWKEVKKFGGNSNQK